MKEDEAAEDWNGDSDTVCNLLAIEELKTI